MRNDLWFNACEWNHGLARGYPSERKSLRRRDIHRRDALLQVPNSILATVDTLTTSPGSLATDRDGLTPGRDYRPK